MNKEKMLSFIQKQGKNNRLIIIGLVGILLIGLSGFFPINKTTQRSENNSQPMDTQLYAQQLEERLETLLSTVHGVGRNQVMVTMEQGPEYVYATEEKNSMQTDQTSESDKISTENKSSDEEKYIMIATDEGDQPLLLTQLAPRVKGVVVVCEGGNNETVCRQVVQVLATALDIGENRICVAVGATE